MLDALNHEGVRNSEMGKSWPSSLRFDHLVLEVEDPVRSVEFYRRVLGLTPVRLRAFMAGRGPFSSSRGSAETALYFFPPTTWRVPPPPPPPPLLFFLLPLR